MSQLCPAAFGAREGAREEWSRSRESGAAVGAAPRLPPDSPLGVESGGGGCVRETPSSLARQLQPGDIGKQQDEVSGVSPEFRICKTCEMKKSSNTYHYLRFV